MSYSCLGRLVLLGAQRFWRDKMSSELTDRAINPEWKELKCESAHQEISTCEQNRSAIVEQSVKE
jgi:hypothetical protein